MTFKTTLFKALDQSDEQAAGVGHVQYDVDYFEWADNSETRTLRMNGGDDRITVRDQEIEVDATGNATFKDVDGEECAIEFECVVRRPLQQGDVNA